MLPTARTLKECRELGYTPGVVERNIHHAHVKKDLFGCIDIIAIQPGLAGALGIQATTSSNLASRRTKILDMIALDCDIVRWLEAGNRLEIWGWALMGKAGRRKVWTVKRVPIFLPSTAVRDGGIVSPAVSPARP